MFYFSILLHCIDPTLELVFRLCATSFFFLSSYSFTGHYMFRSNWPSSGVQVVMVKDSAAHFIAVFFPPIVVVSGYLVMCVTVSFIWVFLGCTWLLLVLFGLLVVGALNVLAGAGVLLCVGRPYAYM
jgi:hypothetical protein